MENSNKSSKGLKALLVGAAIGGALGVLLAPDKGSKTRKKIMAKPKEIKETVKDRINDALDGMAKEVKIVKGKVNKL